MRAVLFIPLFLLCQLAIAQVSDEQAPQSTAEQMEALKKELIALNRDLFVLEEDLLFPASTQVAVYLSVDVGTYFQLDAVEVKLDGSEVTHYLYTDKQIQALHRGGVQRLYMGNIGQGEHEITAFFHGIGPENRPYKRATTLRFEKTDEAKALELQIRDRGASQQPEFSAIEL